MQGELTVIEQRYLAMRDVLDNGAKVVDVATRFGVDRRTVHRWLTLYAFEGLGALADRSHRPEARTLLRADSHSGAQRGPRPSLCLGRWRADPSGHARATVFGWEVT